MWPKITYIRLIESIYDISQDKTLEVSQGKQKKLSGYCQMYPKKVSKVCDYLRKKLFKAHKQGKKEKALVTLEILTGLSQSCIENGLPGIIGLYLSQCIVLLLRDNDDYLYPAMQAFYQYTASCGSSETCFIVNHVLSALRNRPEGMCDIKLQLLLRGKF